MTSEASQHEANHGDVDHGFGGARVAFVIAIEPAIAPQPAEGALDHPAARQHFECVAFGALDDLHRAAPRLFGPSAQRSGIASIGPEVFDLPPPVRPVKPRQQLLGGVPVLNIGGQDQHHQNQPERVHEDMALAAVDFLAGIVAPRLAALGALDAPAVDDRRAGVPVAGFELPQEFAQVRVNRGPQPAVLPLPEVMIDRAPRREVGGQIAPLAAGARQIEHGVEQVPIRVLARAAGRAGLGKTVMDKLPFGVGKISRVAHPQFLGDPSKRRQKLKAPGTNHVFSNTLLKINLSCSERAKNSLVTKGKKLSMPLFLMSDMFLPGLFRRNA